MKTYQYMLIAGALFATIPLFTAGTLLQSDEWVVPSKYKKMENPYANAKDDEQIGKRLFAIHCKSCHGSKGKGDGTKAAQLDTKVPDITTDAFKTQTDGEIYYKTLFGKKDMPSFKEKISDDEDQWMLINYVKSL